MKRIVLRYGLASGAILLALESVMLPLCMNGTFNFENSLVLGYTVQVLSFLMVFFGVRSYRDGIGDGAISFGRAFAVGLLISLITCAVYVIAWEIAYFNFFPDFLDKYNAHALARMRAAGESEAAIREATAKMAEMAKNYKNLFFNIGVTFMEVFPVGLIVALVSAAILRRKPRETAAAAVTA